ncbi:MAG TPA: type II toxin-antitoxin system RelE/ParE family toxin [Bryobacteraceae bacterium]|nr:type II toxin-antitoxin system RelE/ParE family toxin [Bryobacteraceae bacterium]
MPPREPPGPPYRIEWLDKASDDVRVIDQAVAMRLFEGILRFARTGAGDVKTLHGEMAGTFRLRIGDYRVLFTLGDHRMRIVGVRHRSEAYR